MKTSAYTQPVFMARCDVCRWEGSVTSEKYADAERDRHNGVSHPERLTEPTYGKLHYHGVRGLMACTEIHGG